MNARRNWRERADEAGYLAAILDNPPYWVEALDEPFCGVLSMEEVEDVIEAATSELYDMSLQAVEFVVNGASSGAFFRSAQNCSAVSKRYPEILEAPRSIYIWKI